MSVDIAMISACTHIPQRERAGEVVAHDLGEFWSVTIPSLAERYWISIATRFAASTTHSSM